MGRKLIQSLEVPNLASEVYVCTRKSFTKCLSDVSILIFRSILVKKISPVIFDPDHSLKW